MTLALGLNWGGFQSRASFWERWMASLPSPPSLALM